VTGEKMKWLKPLDCGLSKFAEVNQTRDGGSKISRIPDFWLQKVLKKLAGSAHCPSGLHLQFSTDSTQLAFRYSCTGTVGEHTLQKIAFLVDETLYEHQVFSGEHRKEAVLSFPDKTEKLLKIFLPWGAELLLYGIGIDDQATLTPYRDNRKTICFYGDSITQGFYASSPVKTYPYLVSQHLNLQFVNHGYTGASFPDPALAIYLSKEVHWDMLCIAIGSNTYSLGSQSYPEFERIYRIFMEIIRMSKPKQPIFCITPIWRGDSDGDGMLNQKHNSLQDYRNAIRNLVADLQALDRNLYLIDGRLLIDSIAGLSPDRVHPDDSGMEMLAEGIAVAFKIYRL
jgi:lysophospholipase L1-like esterase